MKTKPEMRRKTGYCHFWYRGILPSVYRAVLQLMMRLQPPSDKMQTVVLRTVNQSVISADIHVSTSPATSRQSTGNTRRTNRPA